MALKLIKNKIKSTQRTSKVTKAMEAVSAVKMRKSQERALLGRPYAEAALRILERVSNTNDARRHPLFAPNNGPKHCVIIITSDKGLAGSLNSSVLKEATKLLGEFEKDSIELICFGKKSYEHYMRREYVISKHFLNVSDEIEIDALEEVVKLITDAFMKKTYSTVHIVYQSFVSTFEQQAVMRQVLPLKNSALQEIVKGIIPKHGKYSDETAAPHVQAYTVEPNQASVYWAIFPTLINIMVYHALLESKASEHSARMVAMKNATDKAKEVIRDLTLQYNKERQSVITAEVSEITGGIEAMNKK
ncbi:MAG: ATP synthase F1 subunit gamma [Minisyncoccia bacterium]